MRSRTGLASLLVSLSLACVSPPAPSAPVGPAAPKVEETPAVAKPKLGAALGEAQRLTEEQSVDLPSGAKTTVPSGWSLTALEGGLFATDPDGELAVHLFVFEGSDARAAKDVALEAAGKDAPASVGDEVSLTDEGGWDEIFEVVHPPATPGATIFVVNVRRKGDRVVASVLEGKPGSFNKRNAQMRQIVFGMSMPGMEEEDLAKVVPADLDAAKTAEFEAAIEEIRQRTGAPAIAVAVVRDGKVVFSRAIGKKRVDKDDRVDTRTRFMIGSVTKSLSTLMIAKLVDDGKLMWTTKVKDLLPDFETGDAAFTERLTIADTFCACTGMPRKDMELTFEYADVPPAAVFGAFNGVKPTTGFGETFQYSNQMTALGGFLAARVHKKGDVGKAYAAALRDLVFEPMGMRDATADFTLGSKDAAQPHSTSLLDAPEAARVIDMKAERFVVPYAPAGVVFASIEDMARYAMVELAGGVTPEGKRIFSEQNLVERRKPRTKASAKGWYGLGLGSSRRKGVAVVSHDGGTFGFSSRLFLVPERNLGLVVLTNGGGSSTLDAVTGRFLEIVYGEKPRAMKTLDRALSEETKMLDKLRKTSIGTVPADRLQAIVGKHRNPRLGMVQIRAGAGGDFPTLDAGEWKSRFGFKKDGSTETLTLIDPPVGGLPIRLDGDALVIDFQQDTYRFERVK
jgi:CubicO group peptidase (beta-lactamase class C family)